MPRIEAFRGLRYDPDKISFISRVVAPPFDVIDHDLYQDLFERDPHNVIRLVLGKTPDIGRSDREYLEAAQCLSAWRDQGVLIREQKPAIYIVEQHFGPEGERVSRLGFVGRLLLEEFGSQVFPHECTMPGPKADRLKLIRTCRTNLSQVFGIYSDPGGQCDRFLQEIKGDEPLYEFRDHEGVACILTRIDDPGKVNDLKQLLLGQTLCIADGHHRYETALLYRDEARPPSAPHGSAPQDFTTVLCVSVANGGLKILPVHRVVKAMGEFDERRLVSRLREEFDVSQARVKRADDFEGTFDVLKARGAEIGCYLAGGKLYGLHIREGASATIPEDELPDVREQPVSVLSEVILAGHFGLDPYGAGQAGLIEYHHETERVYWEVESGRFHVGFLVPPIDAAVVECVARSGQRLPPKSTFFYPKMPCGLVMYPFEDG